MDQTRVAKHHHDEDHLVLPDAPGTAPGTVLVPAPGSPPPVMDLIAFDGERLVEKRIDSVDEVEPYLADWHVIWLNVDGLGDAEVVLRIGELFGLHKLTLEDVIHVHQRPKVEVFPGYVFVVVRMVFLEGELETEQLSLVIGDRFLLTFQEGRPGDCLEPVRARLRRNLGRMRQAGPDYLAYALIDAVTDHYFPVVAEYGERLDALEDEVMREEPYDDIVTRIHENKRELQLLRRTIFPQRDLVSTLIRDPNPLVGQETRTFLRDVGDHTVQLIELVDSYRELAAGLVDIHLSLSSNRMNEVMKLLTLVGALFIPLTFVAGLYGMNFDTSASSWNMPELLHPLGYPLTLLVMLGMSGGMLFYFRRKGWLGRKRRRP